MTESPAPRIVAGLQPVREAIRARAAELQRVLVERSTSPRLEAVARFARDAGVPRVDRVHGRQLDELASREAHQGAIALAPPLELLELDAILGEQPVLAIALDGVTDPQNFGAVIRSAVALAGAAVLWGEHASAPLSTATFRASAGAVEHARLCRVPSLPHALIEARDRGVTVIGLDPNAERRLTDFDLREPVVMVVGSEHAGLARAVRKVVTLAALSSRQAIDSLNASVAAAVGLYEAVRQRSND